jgi:hypothetical protein
MQLQLRLVSYLHCLLALGPGLNLTTTKIVVSHIRYDLLSRLYGTFMELLRRWRGSLHHHRAGCRTVDMMNDAIVTKMLPSLVASGSLSCIDLAQLKLFLAVLIIFPLFCGEPNNGEEN